ncbi:ADP-ribosylglycohydrolase [Marinobacter nauticus VT8]|uniref:ADP-ribosylglycohydrolase n=1 Tax=Marinobacter nauticus (strain ATCC 700491 / DSM 11845 / VT8) TaxID=351348 RepID=A1U092_MARN8|nr:ADP-ribosylglycohydrolase [Marinobacter nauticus VT8]
MDALSIAKTSPVSGRGYNETFTALDKTIELIQSGKPQHIAIQELGEDWVAKEAQAISIYCALVAENFEQGIMLAGNRDGDSDSPGL